MFCTMVCALSHIQSCESAAIENATRMENFFESNFEGIVSDLMEHVTPFMLKGKKQTFVD